MSRILDHLWAANSCRRSISAALLAAYILTAAGIPLPYAGSHHSDELYPCANCACGCTSAEHCWRSCCCHTLVERIAWAHAHDVRPPDHAIAEARVAGLDLAWLGASKSGSSDGARVATCCLRASNKPLPACCQKQFATCGGPAEPFCSARYNDEHKHSNKLNGIIAWRALACHGQSMNWLAAVPTLIIVRPEMSHELPLVAWLGPATSDCAAWTAVDPDVPPPERA